MEKAYEEAAFRRQNGGGGGGGSWDSFGWMRGATGVSFGSARTMNHINIYTNVRMMRNSNSGGYWNTSMSSPHLFGSNTEAANHAVSSDSDITVTAYSGGSLGSQDILYENVKTGTATVIKTPFWEITGSYYNELYYFSGLVAFDIFQAQRELVATGASVDLTIAIGPVGFSIEAGNIEHKGGVHRFFSIGHAYGLEASISMNSINIREYPNSSFSPQNYAGWNTTKNNSFTYFTYGRESALQYTQPPYLTYGYKANHYSFGIGVLPIGWSEARTYTWVGKRRERYQYNFYDFK